MLVHNSPRYRSQKKEIMYWKKASLNTSRDVSELGRHSWKRFKGWSPGVALLET